MSGTILLADDSLTIQKVVELTFADTDHTIVTVSSGDELLEQLSSVRPDLVICDVLMPGTDGYAVCQTIKSDPEWLHVPVVLLTGTFEPFDRDRAIAAGCNEIITKPFEARKLVETVEKLLRQGSTQADDSQAPTPEFEGAMAPPSPDVAPPEPTGEEAYGTVLAPPAAEEPFEEAAPPESAESPVEESGGEGLEFTTTGFDEMRSAGEEPRDSQATVPEEGLEFDSGTADEGGPFSDGKPSSEPFGASSEGEFDHQEPAFEFGGVDDASFQRQEPPVEASQPPDRAHTMPMEQPSFGEAEEAEETGEPDKAAAEAPAPGVAEAEEYDSPPTSPVVVPAEAGPAAAVAEPSPPAEEGLLASTALSDEDVDRIARRVIELASDRLEQIAWEVLPDMAEIVVRERIRQLEAEAESEGESQTH